MNKMWQMIAARTMLAGLRGIEPPNDIKVKRCPSCGTWQHNMFYALQEDSPEAVPMQIFQCANPNCGSIHRWVD